MEEIKMYSVFDIKAERYDTPFFCMDDLFAQRHFYIMMQKDGTMVSTFKNDFRLDCLGSINVKTGVFTNGKKLIIDGIQIQKEEG